MPNAQSVKPKNFNVDRIIYDDGDFAVAWGTWQDGSPRLGMHWNGEAGDPGYPKLFGNPVWKRELR